MAYRRRKYKRIRKLSEIEVEIENHLKRKNQHLQWVERNRHFAKRKMLYCEGIIKRIIQFRKTKTNYKKLVGIIQSKKLTKNAQEELANLEQELANGERRALWDVPMLDFPHEIYRWEEIPDYLYKELNLAKKRERKKEKQRNLRARAAQAENKTREAAAGVKSRLPRDHWCPYCGGNLGTNPHADHIYPVSRGGLSTESNMVYICSDCNIKKRNKTLRMFINEFGLDRDLIEERLSALGKEF